MHRFEDLDDVQSALQKLMQREPALVKVLPRQPGTKESRYTHLLSGDVEIPDAPQSFTARPTSSSEDHRVTRLEEEVDQLRKDVANLKEQFAEFRK